MVHLSLLNPTPRYWNNEFLDFYNPQTGLDIDGAWIDMNEPASVCESRIYRSFALSYVSFYVFSSAICLVMTHSSKRLSKHFLHLGQIHLLTLMLPSSETPLNLSLADATTFSNLLMLSITQQAHSPARLPL